MKGLSSLLFLGLLASCGVNRGYKASTGDRQACVLEGNYIVCPDGSKLEVKNGQDGVDGSVPLVISNVLNGDCTEVYPGVYVENIDNGDFFDVYHNDQCSDSLGEYCDNVMTSYGSSGTFGNNQLGSGNICWADNLFVTGVRKDDDSIDIRIMDFN